MFEIRWFVVVLIDLVPDELFTIGFMECRVVQPFIAQVSGQAPLNEFFPKTFSFYLSFLFCYGYTELSSI
jgi:hypothetical protein